MTTVHEAAKLGQSVWNDYISRGLLSSGGLRRLIQQGIRGVTSNPAIFNKAISSEGEYDTPIAELARDGVSDLDIYERLVLEDIRAAADEFRELYDCSGGDDGFVSLELDPRLADDGQETLREARRLWTLLDRPNCMIKIPATEVGITAIEDATAEGICVNATLIFSLAHSEAVNRAYIRGLERRIKDGHSLNGVRSVASLFVSRLDGAVDPLVEGRVPDLLGTAGVDNARLSYRCWREIFSGPEWDKLSAAGASPQRMLWASTGTKNPAYRDTLYVEELIGPETVNTVPPGTLKAFLEHGRVANRIEHDLDGAVTRRKSLADLGINLDDIGNRLRSAGVAAFQEAFDSLLKAVNAKIK
ncbi:MAG: transaldolase [Dethiosulfovibrio peptidovorans]|nr:MAG: transaldolase [Dethiosulfovibrio peptidovorans]